MRKTNPQMANQASESQAEKPESFARFENFVRQIVAVPKADVDALEKEEKRKGRKRTTLQPKPAK